MIRTCVMFFDIMKTTAMIPAGSEFESSPFFRGEEGARDKKTSSDLRKKLIKEMESYLRTGSDSREDGAAFNAAGKALALELWPGRASGGKPAQTFLKTRRMKALISPSRRTISNDKP